MGWHELTFTASHVLTASDLNTMQGNFAAVAQGAPGAPPLAVNSLLVSGVASVGTLHVCSEAVVGGVRIQFRSEHGQADGGASRDGWGPVSAGGPVSGGGVPPGALMAYVGTTPPAGWLLCDGATLGNAQSGADWAGARYEPLFKLVQQAAPNAGSESFGNGDRVRLPDLRGRVVVALDNLGGQPAQRLSADWADTLGAAGGTAAHAHPLSGSGYAQLAKRGDSLFQAVVHTRAYTATSGLRGRGWSGALRRTQGVPLGGNTEHSSAVQPSLALGYLIKI